MVPDNTEEHIWRDSDQRLAMMCIIFWIIWVQVLVCCVCNCECHVVQQDWNLVFFEEVGMVTERFYGCEIARLVHSSHSHNSSMPGVARDGTHQPIVALWLLRGHQLRCYQQPST